MPDTTDEAWTLVQEQLRRRLTPHQYRTWFQYLRAPGEPQNGTFTISVPNEFFREWIGRNYMDVVRESVAAVTPGRVEVRLRVDPTIAPSASEAEPPPAPATGGGLPLNPHYTFDAFVVGPSNRLAHAASKAVAEGPGQVYNPLYVHGGVGLGKSHLLQAICHALLRRTPPPRIVYLSCESFVNEFISAIQHGSLDTFRARCRNVDALVIDDIQFLERAERSQEEFFHTFNALHNAQKQIVLSSDSEPRGIAIEPRLTSRFASGLVAHIDPPDLETRAAILRRKAELRGITLPDDVVAYVAQAFTSNIRELEGALVKLTGYASLSNQPLNLALAQEALAPVARAPSPVTIQDILTAVANHFRVRVADLQSKRRTRSIVLPRQICMHLARALTNHSLAEIGGYFGGRDHSTVLYADNKIQGEVKGDTALREVLTKLRAELVRET